MRYGRGPATLPPCITAGDLAIQFISSSHLFRVMHQCIHKALSPKRPHDSTTLNCLASSLTDRNILRGSSLRFRMRRRLDEPLLPAACIGFAGSASDCGNSSGPQRCTATVPVPAAPLKAAMPMFSGSGARPGAPGHGLPLRDVRPNVPRKSASLCVGTILSGSGSRVMERNLSSAPE